MTTYTIQAGDAFTSIASLFNITIGVIEAFYPGFDINNEDGFIIGQGIDLPVGICARRAKRVRNLEFQPTLGMLLTLC